MQFLPGSDGVDRPAALLRKEEDLEGRAKYGTTGFTASVTLTAPKHNDRAQRKKNGRQSVGEPEADILLGKDHGNLADEGTNINEEVEPHVDALDSDSRVDNNALAAGEGLDVDVLLTKLLHD